MKVHTARASADLAPASPVYAWYVVALLTASLILSYINRYVPSLVLDRIKSDMALDDFQVGLILGPAFIILYLAFGIPIGWLADRFSRRAILAASIAIWCVMTAAGGFAPNFAVLFATRLGVGMGEAAVAPCAISLISDYFSRQHRSRAINVYQSGTFLGAGLTFFFVGPLLQWIERLPPIVVPGLGAVHSWQSCFLLIGLPGIVVAALMFTVKEPARHERVRVAGDHIDTAPSNMAVTAAFMLKRWRAFGALIAASGCNSIFGALAYWNVALFSRSWGWNTAQTGIAVGLALLIGGGFGTAIALWLTARADRARRIDGPLRVVLAGLSLSVPAYATFALVPTPTLGVTFMFLGHLGSIVTTAAGPACIPLLTPGQMRSQATAIYIMLVSLIGVLIGPPLIGWLADAIGGVGALAQAITIETLLFGLPTLAIVAAGLKSFRAAAGEMEALMAVETS